MPYNKKLSILMIEDSPTDKAIFERFLTQTGLTYELQHVELIEDGLELMRKIDFHLVLLDYLLPDGEGLEFIHEVHQQDHVPAIILITGSGDESVAVSAIQAGAQNYLVKNRLNPTALKVAIMKALTDIDLKRQIAKQYQKLIIATQKAEEANQLKSHFLASMSHELRTPLNAILGFSQLLNDSQGLSVDQQNNVQIILRSARHLLNLINDVLSMSSIEAGRVYITNTDFDPVKLLIEVQEMLSLRLQAKGLTFHIEGLPDLPSCLNADEGKLRQIIVNLLNNSIKYTREGGIAIRVRYQKSEDSLTDMDGEPGLFIFEVSDSGIGISEEDLSRIFESFTRVGASTSNEGTGLGLSITKRFIELMGGDIKVTSKVHQGTTFYVQIPVLHFPGKQIASEESEKLIRLAEDEGEYRILVAEDRLSNRLLIEKLLNSMGFSVKTVVNGQQAIDATIEWNPHLIFMDSNMPVMNGIESTRCIKEFENPPYIVALTASVFEHERQEIFDAGCDAYIAKPFKKQDLVSVIIEYLDVKFEEVIKQPMASVKTNRKLETEEFALIPLVLIDDLDNSLSLLDATQIKFVAEKIRSFSPDFAELILEKIQNYEFEELTTIIASYKTRINKND